MSTTTATTVRFNLKEQAELQKVAVAAYALDMAKAPEDCWTDDGTDVSGRWSKTSDEMRKHLKRELTDGEITALSLSRAYGPTPALSDDVAKRVIKLLFPNGNNTGGWYEWSSLSEMVQKIVARF